MSQEMDDMRKLVDGLASQMGRLPTEDEVYAFIFGSEEQRKEILENAKKGAS